MITLGFVYVLAGLTFAAFAALGLQDRSNPKRFGNAAFWGLLALSMLGGDYLGEAICPRLAGIDPAEAVKAARAEQGRILAERTREAKAEARRMTKGPHLVELVLGQARKDRAGVVAFPKPTVAHSTPQIDAATQAANAAERPVAVAVESLVHTPSRRTHVVSPSTITTVLSAPLSIRARGAPLTHSTCDSVHVRTGTFSGPGIV